MNTLLSAILFLFNLEMRFFCGCRCDFFGKKDAMRLPSLLKTTVQYINLNCQSKLCSSLCFNTLCYVLWLEYPFFRCSKDCSESISFQNLSDTKLCDHGYWLAYFINFISFLTKLSIWFYCKVTMLLHVLHSQSISYFCTNWLKTTRTVPVTA